MQDEFDAPTAQENYQHDFNRNPLNGKQPITYNAGSLDATGVKMWFAGKIDKNDLLCTFKYYNLEAREKVEIKSFTAYLLGVYYGSFSNGKERGEINFQTNLVSDTRTDILQCFYFIKPNSSDKYRREVLATGNYKADIVPALERNGRKGSYTKVLVCYIPELDEVRAIHLNATSEAGFLKAIATARGIPEYKANLWGMTDLESEIWAFRVTGDFEPVVFTPQGQKNTPATVSATAGAQKIYFQPIIKAGVIRMYNEKWMDIFNKVSELQVEFAEYIESEQSYYREFMKKKSGAAGTNGTGAPERTETQAYNPVHQPEMGEGFPIQDVTSYDDDLPF